MITLAFDGPAVLLMPRYDSQLGIRLRLYTHPTTGNPIMEFRNIPSRNEQRLIDGMIHLQQDGRPYRLDGILEELKGGQPFEFTRERRKRPEFSVTAVDPASWTVTIQPGIGWRAFTEDEHGFPGVPFPST